YIAKLNQTNSLILDILETQIDAHVTFIEHRKVFDEEFDSSDIKPDLVFFDLNTSTELKNAPEKIRLVIQSFSNPVLIVLHSYAKKKFIEPLLEAGANGLIPVTPTEEELLNSIEETLAGKTYISFH
ncbi:MAG: hypothetical protein RI564_10655, partial [Gracilimonas sp.]|nr:hypothetical protein [Gracilimonas sp.]